MVDYHSNDDMDIDLPAEWSSNGGVVRFSAVDWEHRARVAADGAEQLQTVINSIRKVRGANQFGDCVEGRTMHEKATVALTDWQRNVERQQEQLRLLAADCRRAARELEQSDADSAAGFQI